MQHHTNNVPKSKFGHIQKTHKRLYNNVCGFFRVTLFIQFFIHFRKKSVAARVFSILHTPAQSALMNKIMHIS